LKGRNKMAETQTNLRQSNAKITAEGIVSEKDLKVVTEEGKTRIEGSVTIKTDDTNFIRFNVRVNEKTNAGAENRTYTGIETVMNEYKSIAEVGEEEADKVRVSGDLNIFTGQNGTSVGYRGNFFNRLKNPDEYEPKAEFSVETFISSIVPEVNTDGDETGRVIVNGWVPTYNGIEPVKLVAEGDVAAAVDSTFEPGQTVEFYGDVVNSRVEKITEIPVAIGKPRRKVETSFKNELVITGASEAYEEGVSVEKPYEADVIKAAIQERQNRLEEAKAKAQNASKTAAAKPSGASKGRTLGL
jgi:hypothetical protein